MREPDAILRQARSRRLRPEPELALARADAHIAWALAQPQVSGWLQAALRSARDHDPLTLQNDIELLRHLALPYARAATEAQMETAGPMDE